MAYSTADRVHVLAYITTRTQAGRHFHEVHNPDIIEDLEAAGLIEIHRQQHPSGVMYSPEYDTVVVTEAGQDLVDGNEEYWGVDEWQ